MMAGIGTVVDELAAMLEPLRIGRRRPRLTLVERDGSYECYRNRRRPVLLASGRIDNLDRDSIPREMLAQPIEVRLDVARVLTKILQLPAASRSYLDAIVTHQLERTTPWAADRIVFDYTLAEDGAAGKDQIAVRLVAIARDAFDSFIERLKQAGLRPAAVGTSDDPLDRPSPINLLGVSRAARRRALRRSISTTLIAVAIIGAAASAFTGWRLYAVRAEEAAVQGELQAARRAIEEAIANTEAAEGFRRLLALKEDAVPMVSLVDILSELIPTSTYLTEMTVDGDELRVVGFSTDAPALIRTLEDADILADVRFGAPTTRDEGAAQDRFEIVARIAPARAVTQ
jgi:general secretion pathway protein L